MHEYCHCVGRWKGLLHALLLLHVLLWFELVKCMLHGCMLERDSVVECVDNMSMSMSIVDLYSA